MPATAMNENYRKQITYTISQNIKRIMKDTHITNGELSTRMGISQSLLSHYTNGSRTPSVDVLVKMCDSLLRGYTVDDLVYKPDENDKLKKIKDYARDITLQRREIEKLKKENEDLKKHSRRVNINDYPSNDDYDKYKYIAESLPMRDFKRYEADYEGHRK